MLSIVRVDIDRYDFSMVDHFFAFANSISLSSNHMFLAVDYEFGMTEIHRIHYHNGDPHRITRMSEMYWNGSCKSQVDGEHWVCATAGREQVVVWDIVNGWILRVLRPFTRVTGLALDEDFGGIWITADADCFFYSLNGKLLVKLTVKTPITAIVALPLPVSEIERYALCGGSDGTIFIVWPKLGLGTAAVRPLPSEHGTAIDYFAIHPDNKKFISVDKAGLPFVWTGLGLPSSPMPLESYLGCALCGRQHGVICTNCARAVCPHCAPVGACHFCSAWEAFVGPVNPRK
jgi:WD40 repeat protein